MLRFRVRSIFINLYEIGVAFMWETVETLLFLGEGLSGVLDILKYKWYLYFKH